ncbi:MAG: hypothetical protein COU08_00325 [Candidatus Harrisonbacteria bacterium CG10_big_fil_rev_8_21_14_0_10_42_17]|uniref:Polyprenol-phosphate-mannose--protein mannosyltransferase n=1 Tax=Candidatus Harrisonbacteria bacterium CG10_big_fil_rev_8_21_14_0_10_42_17 TaxID=1974584 RepID=A0A2M6WJ78_9BACT|nr:MAG: hypothetical protein COU08_00325 [Candidatus Harrisonbacteria bacterium CG10_big_fil_rev_8_21_14_0_10_42_17]
MITLFNNERFVWRITFFLILLVGLFTRMFMLGAFSHPVFDEVYYATFTAQYISGTAFIDAHPPIARFIFFVLGILGGADGSEQFIAPDIPFADFPYLFLRFGSALAGVFLIGALMLFAREVTGSYRVGILAGFLALFDNFLLVQSRYILAEPFLLLFGVLGLWAFYRKNREPLQGRQWYLWFFFSSSMLGLAIGVKASAAVFLILPWFVFYLYDRRPRYRFLIALFFLFLIPFSVVFVSTYAHFALLNPEGPVLHAFYNPDDPGGNSIPFFVALRAKHLPERYGPHWGLFLQRFAETSVTTVIAGGSHLDRAFGFHDAASPWYSWMFMEKPILFVHEGGEGISETVTLIGNPVVWWGGLFALFAVFVRRVDRKQFVFLDMMILGFVFNLFLASLPTRELFIYLYLPSLIFLIVISATALEYLSSIRSRVALSLMILVVFGFLWFSPVSYGFPLSHKQVRSILWFDSWSPIQVVDDLTK